MAGNYLTLHTNDRVVVTTSRGNQEKWFDALFLNQDRHLNNIALIRDRSRYKPCPIFDCGDSFLLDFALYSPEIESRAYLTKAQCLPFKSRFTQTVHTAQALYGKQLEVNIDRASIDTILDKYLCVRHEVA